MRKKAKFFGMVLIYIACQWFVNLYYGASVTFICASFAAIGVFMLKSYDEMVNEE